MVSLSNIELDSKCKILNLDVNKNILRRFLDIGLIPGAVVRKILNSPFGGISAYSIMGTVIAIRDSDLEGVMVEYV